MAAWTDWKGWPEWGVETHRKVESAKAESTGLEEWSGGGGWGWPPCLESKGPASQGREAILRVQGHTRTARSSHPREGPHHLLNDFNLCWKPFFYSMNTSPAKKWQLSKRSKARCFGVCFACFIFTYYPQVPDIFGILWRILSAFNSKQHNVH